MVTFYRFIKTADPFLIINVTHCLLLCAWLSCCGSYACSVSADSVAVCRCVLPALSLYTELVSSIRINNGDYVIFFYCCSEREREGSRLEKYCPSPDTLYIFFISVTCTDLEWSTAIMPIRLSADHFHCLFFFFFFFWERLLWCRKNWQGAESPNDVLLQTCVTCAAHTCCVSQVLLLIVFFSFFFFIICFYLRKGPWHFFHHFCWLIIFETPRLIANNNFNWAFEITSL